MKLPINHFKRALKTGQPQFGLWLGLPDSICAEIGASAGFDWVLIDSEHAPYTMRDIHNSLQAVAPYEVSSIVRPVAGHTEILKQLLDVGAQTILVPMVETAEQARKLAKDVLYPPQGIRGVGSSMARAACWNGVKDYLHNANQEICLLVQVESEVAMQNLAEIVTVEGVDGVFIGPNDLAAAMNHVGNAAHPDVAKVIDAGLETILASDKAAGILAVDESRAKDYVARGVNFIGVGVDASLLATAVRQLAKRYKPDS